VDDDRDDDEQLIIDDGNDSTAEEDHSQLLPAETQSPEHLAGPNNAQGLHEMSSPGFWPGLGELYE